MNAAPTSPSPAPHWRLLRVFDVRPIDFMSGKRAPISDEDRENLPRCNRCGKPHAKVYEVTDGRRTLAVGSGCVKIACDGWEPRAEEIKAVLSAERSRLKVERTAEATKYADAIVLANSRAQDACPVPQPRMMETREGTSVGTREIWGEVYPDGSAVQVWTWPSEGFDAERRGAYVSSWKLRTFKKATTELMRAVPLALQAEVSKMILNRIGY